MNVGKVGEMSLDEDSLKGELLAERLDGVR
jgi:hypothetical protein